MYETIDSNRLVSPSDVPARTLTNDYLQSYAIEDESQANAYRRLAELVSQVDAEGGLVISVTPGLMTDDGPAYHTIIVTVSS